MRMTLAEFISELSAGGLLDNEQASHCLRRFGMDVESGDAETFAQKLVADGKLTQFQATAALQKRTNALVIGDYHVLDVIGAGGMGQVYKARHRIMERLVAIKVMHTARAANPKLVQRFYREVKAAARLSHPNIVTAHDAGETSGGLFMAMEYVDGTDMAAVVRARGRLTVNQAVNVTLQAARGLAYAHEHNMVHRDIKPGNLLLSRGGTVKILDMGLARFTEEADDGAEVSLTMAGRLMGTVEYMSPEHAANAREADHRSDMYSLGCTMYRLLTGRLPYGGQTALEKAIAQREHPIPRLANLIGRVPEGLQEVFARMVAKRPEDRYQLMDDCISDLLKVAPDAEQYDISGLMDFEVSSASTVIDAEFTDAKTTIPEDELESLPETLDAGGSPNVTAAGDPGGPELSVHQAPTVDLPALPEQSESESPPRRSWKLLLAELAIIAGVLVGIGLRAVFGPGNPSTNPTPRTRPETTTRRAR